MRLFKFAAVMVVSVAVVVALPRLATNTAAASNEEGSDGDHAVAADADDIDRLAPMWGPAVRQWAGYIDDASRRYGLDPDLIAAIIQAESGGDASAVSYVGAIGLMGVMPNGPGFGLRPPAEELANPAVNLSWGSAILADILRQSGGDIHAALAAYNGGWYYVNYNVPRNYAADVLNNYGAAVASRNGIDVNYASRWTIAIEFRRGHVSNERLIMAEQPEHGEIETYGGHVVYRYAGASGNAYVKGYAVPLQLAVGVQ